MKKTPYIIAAVVAFLSGFPLAYVLLKPIGTWTVPDGVTIVAIASTDPIQVAMLFSVALGAMLATFPIGALVLRQPKQSPLVLSVALTVALASAWAMRLSIHHRLQVASQVLAVDTHMLPWRELHLETIPIAGLMASIATIMMLRLKRRTPANITSEPISNRANAV